MNGPNIRNCLVIILISIISIILYDFEFYYYGKREGFVGIALSLLIKGVTWLLATAWTFLIPMTTMELIFAIALTIAIEVPSGVYRAKDRQVRLREQRAQLNGVNQTAYLLILEEGEGKDKGKTFRYPVKVPSFKCTDENVIKSECTTFQCDLPFIRERKRRMVPKPLQGKDGWKKESNGKKMRTVKRRIRGVDNRWSKLIDCYAATYSKKNAGTKVEVDPKTLEETIKDEDVDVDKLPWDIDFGITPDDANWYGFGRTRKQTEIRLKEKEKKEEREELKDLDEEGRNEIIKIREKRAARQKNFEDMITDYEPDNNDLKQTSKPAKSSTQYNSPTQTQSKSLIDAKSQANELLNIESAAGERQNTIQTLIQSHCQRFPDDCK